MQILRCNCHQPLLIPQPFKLSHWQQKNMMIDQGRASCLRLRPGLSSLHIVDLWLQRMWGKPWWARRPCTSLQKYKKCVCVFVLHYKFNESISTPNISRELVVFSLFSHLSESSSILAVELFEFIFEIISPKFDPNYFLLRLKTVNYYWHTGQR